MALPKPTADTNLNVQVLEEKGRRVKLLINKNACNLYQKGLDKSAEFHLVVTSDVGDFIQELIGLQFKTKLEVRPPISTYRPLKVNDETKALFSFVKVANVAELQSNPDGKDLQVTLIVWKKEDQGDYALLDIQLHNSDNDDILKGANIIFSNAQWQ